MQGKRLLGFALLAAGVALAASAEVYRWTDAQGVDHYTSDLRKVPAAQRDLARATVLGGKGSLQRIGPATPRPSAASETPSEGARASAPPAAMARRDDEVEGKTEAQWREEAARLRGRVALYAPVVERCAKDRFAWSPGEGGDAYREEEAEAEGCRNSVEEYEMAQESLADFEERAHVAGVPPGWIRE